MRAALFKTTTIHKFICGVVLPETFAFSFHQIRSSFSTARDAFALSPSLSPTLNPFVSFGPRSSFSMCIRVAEEPPTRTTIIQTQ